MIKKLITTSLLCSLLIIGSSVQAFAAPKTASKPSTSTTPLGIDVSWPQCGATLPTNHAFGIVGVNGGLATTTNDCMTEQLLWANTAIGGTVQPKVQLYVNTANPGGLGTSSWPSNNVDSTNTIAPNPYGTCDNHDTLACAWQYGWNRAVEDVLIRFQPAATRAGMSVDPASYIWWLDVETENTWKLGGSVFDTQSNTAVLEGMTAYFTAQNAQVGLYSTAYQWSQIVGTSVSSTSNLNNKINWRPGGASLKTAKSACTAKPLTTGGTVVLTQYIANSLDYNYSCI